jgi:hypothetical protein
MYKGWFHVVQLYVTPYKTYDRYLAALKSTTKTPVQTLLLPD